MGSIVGENLKMSIFGESHGSHVGGTLDGLPAGKKIDFENIKNELYKRSGKGGTSTSRVESEDFEIISGIFNGYTTGMPLTIIIKNNNKESKDYEKTKDIPRPSHADFVAFKKYSGFNDYRGGGHFSARLTAPIVALGCICKDILKEFDIEIKSHLKTIGKFESKNFLEEDFDVFDEVFPVYNEEIKKIFEEEILRCRDRGDSVGGSVQTIVKGLSIGFGEPIFNTIEGKMSSLLFSIPAVKGVEFGGGIDMSKGYGSDYNDQYEIKDSKIVTSSNFNGGVNGGISNGGNIIFTTFFKPTPSIGLLQKSVNLVNMREETLEIIGRHDPCVVVRGVHIVNNLMAFGILDLCIKDLGGKYE